MGPADRDDHPGFDDEEIPPRPSKRVPVTIFLIGWFCLPFIAFVLGELDSPWTEVAIVVILAFVAAFVWAVVRVVKNF